MVTSVRNSTIVPLKSSLPESTVQDSSNEKSCTRFVSFLKELWAAIMRIVAYIFKSSGPVVSAPLPPIKLTTSAAAPAKPLVRLVSASVVVTEPTALSPVARPTTSSVSHVSQVILPHSRPSVSPPKLLVPISKPPVLPVSTQPFPLPFVTSKPPVPPVLSVQPFIFPKPLLLPEPPVNVVDTRFEESRVLLNRELEAALEKANQKIDNTLNRGQNSRTDALSTAIKCINDMQTCNLKRKLQNEEFEKTVRTVITGLINAVEALQKMESTTHIGIVQEKYGEVLDQKQAFDRFMIQESVKNKSAAGIATTSSAPSIPIAPAVMVNPEKNKCTLFFPEVSEYPAAVDMLQAFSTSTEKGRYRLSLDTLLPVGAIEELNGKTDALEKRVLMFYIDFRVETDVMKVKIKKVLEGKKADMLIFIRSPIAVSNEMAIARDVERDFQGVPFLFIMADSNINVMVRRFRPDDEDRMRSFLKYNLTNAVSSSFVNREDRTIYEGDSKHQWSGTLWEPKP
ncbi:MAG: hypothetical protein P4L16_06580 [Chlamydiales bacterium]|nr:hypothetical protein [Chlamydiales bacterium]